MPSEYSDTALYFEHAIYVLGIRYLEGGDFEGANTLFQVASADGILKYRVDTHYEYASSSGNDLVFQIVDAYLKHIPNLRSSSAINHLWQISYFLPDYSYRNTVQKALMDGMLKDLDFETGFTFIFSHAIPLEIIEAFIDQKARTHEQIERCKQEVLKKVQMQDQEADLTAYFLCHLLLEHRSKLDILLLALETGQDDGPYKLLATEHIPAFINLNKDIIFECEKVYMMCDIEKQLLLRMLLTGK